jgi:hypothetical protein
MKEWDLYSAGLPQEGEQKVILRDITPGPRKYRHQKVRAVISREEIEGADRLWIRSPLGVLLSSKPWFAKIVEEYQIK